MVGSQNQTVMIPTDTAWTLVKARYLKEEMGWGIMEQKLLPMLVDIKRAAKASVWPRAVAILIGGGNHSQGMTETSTSIPKERLFVWPHMHLAPMAISLGATPKTTLIINLMPKSAASQATLMSRSARTSAHKPSG